MPQANRSLNREEVSDPENRSLSSQKLAVALTEEICLSKNRCVICMSLLILLFLEVLFRRVEEFTAFHPHHYATAGSNNSSTL